MVAIGPERNDRPSVLPLDMLMRIQLGRALGFGHFIKGQIVFFPSLWFGATAGADQKDPQRYAQSTL